MLIDFEILLISSLVNLNLLDFDLILESYQKALQLELLKPLKDEVEKEMLSLLARKKKLKDFWK